VDGQQELMQQEKERMRMLRMGSPRRRKAAGFSMLELLTVIGVLTFLTAVIAAVFVNFQKKAKYEAAQALIRTIGIALNQYKAQLRDLPPDTGFGRGATDQDPDPGSELRQLTVDDHLAEVVLYDSGSLWRYLGSEVTKYVKNDPYDKTDLSMGAAKHAVGTFGPYMKFTESQLKSYSDPNYGDSFMVIDPWGMPLGYVGDKKRVIHNKDGFDLYSCGPDRKTASNDGKDNGKYHGLDNNAYDGTDNDNDGIIDNASELGESILNGTLTSRKVDKKIDGSSEINEVLDDINNWDPN